MLTRLIVTADDFGLAPEVNDAVEIGYRSGLLTAASLMVGAPAADAAVACARRTPGLAVGLHIVLVDGDPVLDPCKIPGLVDGAGRLRTDLARLGAELAFSERRRAELRLEIEAQFEAYRLTGLTLDHVDVHKHFHLHPIVSREIITIGAAYGMRVLRVPTEPWSILDRIEPTQRTVEHFAIRALSAPLRTRVQAASLVSSDAVFGQVWSGGLTPARMQGLLAELPPGLIEIYAHPATSNQFRGGVAGYNYKAELEAICSAASVTAFNRSGAGATSYAEIIQESELSKVAR